VIGPPRPQLGMQGGERKNPCGNSSYVEPRGGRAYLTVSALLTISVPSSKLSDHLCILARVSRALLLDARRYDDS
jgi:hypothetical protein